MHIRPSMNRFVKPTHHSNPTNTWRGKWSFPCSTFARGKKKKGKGRNSRRRTRGTRKRERSRRVRKWMMNSSSPSSAFVCKRIGPGLLAPGMQAARRAPPFERVSHSWNKDGVGRVAGDPRERVDRYGGEARKRGARTETARRNRDAGAGGGKSIVPLPLASSI